MKKLYIALVAVFATLVVSDAYARRCGTRRCETKCAPAMQDCCPEKPKCCEVVKACGPRPICKKVITQEVCKPADQECYKILQWKCPPGFTEVGSESVADTEAAQYY